MKQVDLNCDMGESFGPWKMGDDEHVLRHISSANVACGFHGGDPRVMLQTVTRAKELGVQVGAHPGFPDLVGFGRRNMEVTAEQARTDVLYQIGALSGFCRRLGMTIQHVKPHGQLNNMAMVDPALAEAIVLGIKDFDPHLLVVAYGGEFARAAEKHGMRVAHEAFADREYHADGTLVSRRVPGSVITDPNRVVERAIQMVEDGCVDTMDGGRLDMVIETLCVHGDTPGAASLAATLREGFARAGIEVKPMAEVCQETAGE